MRLLVPSFLFLLCPALCPVAAHPASAPYPLQQQKDGLDLARTQFAQAHFEAAIELCEEALEANPDKGAAWLLIGRALGASGRWEDALEAFSIASEQQNQAAAANFHAAKLSAAHQSEPEAVALAVAAVQAGLSPRRLWSAPELAALRESKAFQQAVMRPKPSAECFEEKVRILHTFYGEQVGDTFGWIGRNAGDVDRDGKPDLLISAPYNHAGGQGAGKVYLYSGKSGKRLFAWTGTAGQGLGMGIEAAGDMNADGFPDLFAGAPCIGTGSGIAYVYSGKDGSLLHKLSRGERNDLFATQGAGGVDFDGDGMSDLLIGAPGIGPDGKSPGHAYLYSGKSGQVIAELSGERAGDGFGAGNAIWSNGEEKMVAVGAGKAGKAKVGQVYVYRWQEGELQLHFKIEPDATGNALGAMFVCFPGDMDGDGISEVYASDWSNTAKGNSTGRVYVHSGATGRRLFVLTGERAGEGFGTCKADVGDVDGDGVADLLVGAWQESSAAKGGGKCTLYSMQNQSVIATYTCNAPGETLGFDTTSVGDLDGDGGIDFLVTGGYSGVMGFQSGRAFVIAGPVPKQ